MLGVDARTFRVAWTVFLFALLMATLYAIRETLILLAVAIFVAYMLAPLVDLVERFMPKRRGFALAVVYIALVGVLVTAGVTLGSQIVEEASSFFGHLPALMQAGKLLPFPLPAWLEPLRARILLFLQNEAASLQASAVPLLRSFSSHLLSGIGFVLLIVLVPILSFFLLKDARIINSFLVQTLEEAGDGTLIRQVLDDIHVLLSKYIRALVLLALASFIGWAVFLSLTGAPYQLLLAGMAGALEFIPGVGPAVALAIVFVVCSVSGYSAGLLWIIVFWTAFRLFQDYVLNPVLMSAGVQLHPLLVLLGVLAGGQIGGIPGLLFSVPVIAILKVVFMRLREAQIRDTLSHRQAF